MHRALLPALAVLAALGAWTDPSPHQVRLVDVEKGVRLEVLDWGGKGRPIVLLAGYGHSGHVFDDLAPKLTDVGHVLAVTRRGFGASSHPDSGYDDQRLADDVFAVLEALHLDEAVLVGHSLGGSELTTLGNQHSDRLAGLVYLDALQDPKDHPGSDPDHDRLLAALPAAMQPPPCPRDGDTIEAYRRWQLCRQKFALPESELRSIFTVHEDGTMGRHKTPPFVGNAIGDGQIRRDYSKVKVPVLALSEFPRPGGVPDGYTPKDDRERAAIRAFGELIQRYTDRWAAKLEAAVPDARLVDVGPGAGHFVFLTREAEVVKEIRTFVAGLRR